MDIRVNNVIGNPFAEMVYDNQKNVREPFQIQLENKESMEKVEEVSEGEVLGIGFLKDSDSDISYGMAARYAEESTKDHPIVQVLLRKPNNEVEYYNVDITKVNPANATELEMFALCNYMDDKNPGARGKFGSWQALKCIDINACSNGYTFDTGLLENFASAKKNWIGICRMMMDDYLGAGIFKQYKDCINLCSEFSKFV